MSNLQNSSAFFNINGFAIIKDKFFQEVKDIKVEIIDYLNFFGKKNNLTSGKDNDYDYLVRNIMIPGTKLRTFIYDSAPFLQSIQKLNHHPYIKEFLKDFGYKKPVCVDMSNIRFDINDKNEIIHSGMLDRSEGVVDPRTRLTKVVASVEQCFANPFSSKIEHQALEVGQFVKLRLLGSESEVFVIPDSAFRKLDTVLVVNSENQLFSRKVETVHRNKKEVWVKDGLEPGDLVCITPIEIISEGMDVRIADHFKDSNSSKP